MHVVISPAEVFQALADPTRLRIMSLLYQTQEQMCLCEFVESLEDSESNISRQIKCLRNVGLITSIKDGRWVHHEAVLKTDVQRKIKGMVEVLASNDKQFSSDLKRFRVVYKQRANGRCVGPEALDQQQREFSTV